MEILLIMLLLSPLAALFSGGEVDEEPEALGDGEVTELSGSNDTATLDMNEDHAVLAGAGNDDIKGANGWDILAGQAGNDALSGGTGGDVLLGGDGDDRLFGNGDSDDVIGGAGNDLMQGGLGNDYMLSGGGADSIRGGAGNDMVDGTDVGSYGVPTANEMVPQSFTRDDGTYVPGVEENISNWIDRVFGQNITDDQKDDVIQDLLSVGAAQPDVLEGGDGNDRLLGDGDDTLIGGAGDDLFQVYGGPGGPAIIEDYDQTLETIQVYVDDDVAGTLSFTDSADGTVLAVGTETIAILRGVQASQLNGTDMIELRRIAV